MNYLNQLLKFIIISCLINLCSFSILKAEEVLSEQLIKVHLKSMRDGDIAELDEQELLLGRYMQFAIGSKNKSLQVLIAAEQASLKLSIGKLNEAEIIINEYFNYAREFHEAQALISFYYLQSKIAGRRSNYQSALMLAEQMLDLTIATKDESRIADAYLLLGQQLTAVNRLEEALDYLKKALVIFEKLNDGLGTTVTNSSIASLYSSLNEQVKAIEYYQNALIYLKAKGEKFKESIVLFNIGLAYLVLEDYSLAKRHFEEAMLLSIALKDDLGIAYAKTRLAKIENFEGNKELAIKYLSDALPIFEQSNDSRMVYVTSIALATNYSELGEHKKAIQIHKPLLAVAKKLEI